MSTSESAHPHPSGLQYVRLYLELGQDRLSLLVAATAAAGFFLARPEAVHWLGLCGTTLGVFLASVSANTFNQWLERDRDARVPRTCQRPLPSGRISDRHALLWATIAGIASVVLLAAVANVVVALLGLLNIALYAGIYTPLKVRSSLSTVVGAVVGAVPPAMGWLAASGRYEAGAVVVAALLFAWQVPHALAIAWRDRNHSARAGYRTLPCIDPAGGRTAAMAVVYCAALLPVGLAATAMGVAGSTYALGSLALGGLMLWYGVQLWRQRNGESARRLFFASLLYLPALLLLMAADVGPAGVAKAETVTGSVAAGE